MRNHFHLVVETPRPNLSLGMHWLPEPTPPGSTAGTNCSGTCSAAGRNHSWSTAGNGYLKTVCDYVPLNPLRAKLLKTDQAPESFRMEQLA
jgi:putative transposase